MGLGHIQYIKECEYCTKSSAVVFICPNVAVFFKNNVYKNNRDASLEL